MILLNQDSKIILNTVQFSAKLYIFVTSQLLTSYSLPSAENYQ